METVTSSDQPPHQAGDALPHRCDHEPPPLSWRIESGLLKAVHYGLYSLPLVGIGITTDWSFRLDMRSGFTKMLLMYVVFCMMVSLLKPPNRSEYRDVLTRWALLLLWIPITLYHDIRLTRHLDELNSLQHDLAVEVETTVKPGELYLSEDGTLWLRLTDHSIPIDSSDLSIRQQAVLRGRAQRWVDEHLAALKAAGVLAPEELTAQDIARYVQ